MGNNRTWKPHELVARPNRSYRLEQCGFDARRFLMAKPCRSVGALEVSICLQCPVYLAPTAFSFTALTAMSPDTFMYGGDQRFARFVGSPLSLPTTMGLSLPAQSR